MPVYLFSNPKDENNIVEVVMSVHDKHEFYKDGIKWDRVFTKPNASIDTKVDPYNPKDFAKATRKKDTIGALFDRSKELSLKRQDKDGIDLVKEKTYSDYNKKTKRFHPEQRKEKLEKLKNTPLKLKIK